MSFASRERERLRAEKYESNGYREYRLKVHKNPERSKLNVADFMPPQLGIMCAIMLGKMGRRK